MWLIKNKLCNFKSPLTDLSNLQRNRCGRYPNVFEKLNIWNSDWSQNFEVKCFNKVIFDKVLHVPLSSPKSEQKYITRRNNSTKDYIWNFNICKKQSHVLWIYVWGSMKTVNFFVILWFLMTQNQLLTYEVVFKFIWWTFSSLQVFKLSTVFVKYFVGFD